MKGGVVGVFGFNSKQTYGGGVSRASLVVFGLNYHK